jgi:hypothetical protein
VVVVGDARDHVDVRVDVEGHRTNSLLLNYLFHAHARWPAWESPLVYSL